MAYRITVIMGVYNCENTLEEAIDSLICQTYDDWKLVICDDGSDDGTLSLAESFEKKYPDKIKVIKNNKNLGLNVTLNRCLQYVDTEYTARMDGDDISLPNRLKTEILFLDTHPEYAIVSGQMIYFDEKGDFKVGNGGGEPKIDSFPKGTPFCHAPSMTRTVAYNTVGGYSTEPSRLRVEDWDLWIRMYEAGYKGYNLSEPIYKMRDDRNASNRRKFKYRLNEARVSASAVTKFRLPFINYIWSLKPIIVGLLPMGVYNWLHRK